MADNYRGITVTLLFSKILEKAWLLRAIPILSSNQNLLQRGFTKGVAPLNAALLVTESINEASDCKSPLYITFLDASKAFDVVDHEILLNELYLSGIDGSLWVLLRELYREPTTHVKWNNIISEEFNVLQGVRQGGVSSAPVYKSYTNRLLNNLQKHHLGHRIGTVNVSAPTCAGDIAILSNSHHDSQAAINIVEDYAASHRYTINVPKVALLLLIHASVFHWRYATVKFHILKLLSIKASQDNLQIILTLMREFKLQGVQHTPLWELVCMVEMALLHMSRNNSCPHMLFQDLWTWRYKAENNWNHQAWEFPDENTPAAPVFARFTITKQCCHLWITRGETSHYFNRLRFSSPTSKNCWQSR